VIDHIFRPLLPMLTLTLWSLTAGAVPAQGERIDLTSLEREPAAFAGARIENGRALLTAEKWSFLRTRESHGDATLSAIVTLLEPARHLGFFGQSWSVWPDPKSGDGGFEAGLPFRASPEAGYRVQLSYKYQEVALVKYPHGGYLRSVPCALKLKEPHRVEVTAQGTELVVKVDGQEKIRCRDELLPVAKGAWGVGVSAGGKVAFEELSLHPLPPTGAPEVAKHVPKFSARRWLGGRTWVFDGDEPILELSSAADPTLNNAKLLPGYKPLLSWNSHWDIQNQGAYPEGMNKSGEPTVNGGGSTLTARWTSRQVKGRFVTHTEMTVGFDAGRGTYTYDVTSELEVLSGASGDPFQFRYGYDFEHHTPLDPFRWQYLVFRGADGTLQHRPVYPIDPGPQMNLAQRDGLRMWYGRHGEKMLVAPAVEYDLLEAGKRKLNTAVCAAFYDTGVSFEPETALPGTKVKVKYRYTGYPRAEAEELFRASKIYDSWMLDPNHHYIFADEWPKLTFSKFAPMSETWIYGRTPFMTGHNQRPTYELVKDTGIGSGFALKTGPGGYARARLPAPAPLPKGRYAVVAQVKSINTHGPGGRIELQALEAKTGKLLRQVTHYLGKGTFGWKAAGFITDIPSEAPSLAVAFGNAGSGEVLFAEVEFKRLDEGSPVPAGVLPAANAAAPKDDAAPEGALADYRMSEGQGLFVYNHAAGPLGMLELANLDWTVDDGRHALRYADRPTGAGVYPRASGIDRSYLSQPGYKGRQNVPVAITGQHGGGFALPAFTIATWVKPAEQQPDGRGDVIGLGARRFILSLYGRQAPYTLGASLNVNDRFDTKSKLDAGRWYHLAMTGEPTEDHKWRVRLFVNGEQVGDGKSVKLEAPATIPPSLILGAELFYLHSSYYRGLIGRTLVFDRALPAEQIHRLARSP
jgi:hypothetical protein